MFVENHRNNRMKNQFVIRVLKNFTRNNYLFCHHLQSPTPKTALSPPATTWDTPGLSKRCPKGPISAYFGRHFMPHPPNGGLYADIRKTKDMVLSE